MRAEMRRSCTDKIPLPLTRMKVSEKNTATSKKNRDRAQFALGEIRNDASERRRDDGSGYGLRFVEGGQLSGVSTI